MSEEHATLIIGHQGQDGTLLRKQLEASGCLWIGIDRCVLETSPGISSPFTAPVDIIQSEQVEALVDWCHPKEIYYLAACHRGADENPEEIGRFFNKSLAVNVHGPLNVLRAIHKCSSESRFLYASSSLIYGPKAISEGSIHEEEPKNPTEAYAFEKALVGHYCQQYRIQKGIFASVAILFNHESEYRPKGFFARDVTDALALIALGKMRSWEVGSLDSVVDWLYAGDVVDAMKRIISLDYSDDFIVASGEGHTTGEFISIACEMLGLNPTLCVQCNGEKLFRKNSCRVGYPGKLCQATGWHPTMTFPDMVRHLTQAAVVRFEQGRY